MIRIKESCDADATKPQRSEELIKQAERLIRQGLSPPPEIYRIENRRRVDWLQLSDWARPVDPQLFEGCCHEG